MGNEILKCSGDGWMDGYWSVKVGRHEIPFENFYTLISLCRCSNPNQTKSEKPPFNGYSVPGWPSSSPDRRQERDTGKP